MKRIELTKANKGANKTPDFIGSWLIEPESLCDDLIEFFESNEDLQSPGESYTGLDEDIKNRPTSRSCRATSKTPVTSPSGNTSFVYMIASPTMPPNGRFLKTSRGSK